MDPNASILHRVCLVVDFDGFYVNKKFYCRELGYSSLTRFDNGSCRFDLDDLVPLLTPEDHDNINFCRQNIHGLSFETLPDETDALHHGELDAELRRIYEGNKKSGKFYVAYKGGHVEKDALERLGIPHVNLESHGCPKYRDLPEDYKNFWDCGYHDDEMDIKNHCPPVKCCAFRTWLRAKLREAP